MGISRYLECLNTYDDISKMLKTKSYSQILQFIAAGCSISASYLENYPVECNCEGKKSAVYKYVLLNLIKNIYQYDKVYSILADDISRKAFTAYVRLCIIPDEYHAEIRWDSDDQRFVDSSSVSSDEDIMAPVSVIKINIDEVGISGLIGVKNRIKDDNPKLAICTHELSGDIWQTALLITSVNPGYRIYFRCYRSEQNWETVLYAVTGKKTERKTDHKINKKIRHAVAVPDKEGWQNVELTKDCGLIPYLLHKNHHMDVTLIGKCCDEYSYNDKYTKGLKMEFLQTGSVEERLQYIRENASDIDLLILRGPYMFNSELAVEYKRLNPYGKIYVGLDANSAWMDRIIWDYAPFIRYMDCCDLITTSCHVLQKHLNEKWPWKIELIPNGFYKFEHQYDVPEFKKKKNIILTVSRLGTVEKATDVLLDAFALVSEKEPDWNLRLVGSIDEKFDNFIEQYFIEHPQLIDRIEFAGPVMDKYLLYSEYLKAKIFALPSLLEGGTPNVISEALSAGCVTAVTKFDAWEDAVDYGKCGMASEPGDAGAFADILLKLIRDDNLEVLSEKAYQYSQRYFNMESIVAKIHETLFGGE